MRSAWFNKDDQFAPGKELFRSERRFSVWAYTLSHSQLLLRAEQTPTAGPRQTRIDLLFKPVVAVKTQMSYEGLTVRCATSEEHKRISLEHGNEGTGSRVFMIESRQTLDYVVSGAVGWQEDDQQNNEPSALAFFAPATDPTRILPSDLPTPWSAIQGAQLPD